MNKVIKTYRPKKNKYNNILYCDIETGDVLYDRKEKNVPYNSEKIYSPYNNEQILGYQNILCICMVDQYDNHYSFDNIDSYLKHLILNNKKSIVYFHNFGKFDSLFIINWVVKNKHVVGEIKIIERNNCIYELIFLKHHISFRDSLLLIPESLEKIGSTFCNDYKKNIDFDYDKINELWKEDPQKIINHCINDCRVLKEGFLNFKKIVEEQFDIDLTSQLTLPSLSYNIFKKDYYDEKNTPINKNSYEEDEFIRKSYVGGISEVFKPYLEKGYCYDANSLYPFTMLNYKYPIGEGKFVKGSTIDIENFIGFIECEIKVDEELNFLTYKDPIRGLITPVGEWIGVYNHVEIKKAIELGYNIKFLKGFKYDKEDYIFKNFVNKIYNLRKNATTKSMNRIAKLILNSLYGRFGMKIFVESTKFIDYKQVVEYKKRYDITNIHFLGNDTYIVTGIIKTTNSADVYKNTIDTETAVHIASYVTSYARSYMYDFKNIKDNECYYTDTDSIFLKNPLEEKYIGSELGEFKLEYKFEKAFFIAPKIYGYVLEGENRKIIVKGLKKEEKEKTFDEIFDMFDRIIKKSKESAILKIIRLYKFKKDFKRLRILIQELIIDFGFPFNKRIKIFDSNNIWVNSRAINIKKK